MQRAVCPSAVPSGHAERPEEKGALGKNEVAAAADTGHRAYNDFCLLL